MKKIFLYIFISFITLASLGFSRVALASTITRPVSNLGLVGWWTFDEGVGTIAHDFSGNINSAALNNIATAPSTTSSGWNKGKRGKALAFDGINDYVKTNTSIAGSNVYTFSSWVYIAGSQGTIRGIISHYIAVSGCGWQLRIDASNRLVMTDSSASCAGGLQTLTSNTALTTNTWYHVVGIVNNTNASLYINGTLDNSISSFTNLVDVSNPFVIGAGDETRQYFNGLIDDVRIYNRALSATEVSTLYKSGATRIDTPTPIDSLASGLVGYWTMDGKDTTWTSSTTGTVADKSGNGNIGTLTNMTQAGSPVIGKMGQALKFNGTNAFISGTFNAQPTVNSPRTVSAWINRNGPCPANCVISMFGQDSSLPYGYGVYITPSLNIKSEFDSSNGAVTSNATISANKWYHVVAVYNGTTNNIYINGLLDNSVAYSSANTQSGNFQIGQWVTGCCRFNGSLDEMRIYNRALSASEVKQLYNQGLATVIQTPTPIDSLASGLVGYWTMDGKDTTWTSSITGTVADKSGNGNIGTLTNMTQAGSPVIGKMGQAMGFSGALDTQHIIVNNSTSLNMGGSSTLTLSTWVYMKAFNTSSGCHDDSILAKDSDLNIGSYVIYITDSGNCGALTGIKNATFNLRNNSGTAFYVIGSTNLSSQKWYHIVGIFNGTTMAIYVNGILDSTPTSAVTTIGSNTSNFFIGNNHANPSGYTYDVNGIIDDVRIYHRALSASEVKQLYNQGK